MNIKFKKVSFENFLSFQQGSVELDDNGFTLVSGENKNINDIAKSNGSGKSAVWEAISWALTGETIRGVKDVSNIYTDDGALVTLEFCIDEHSYEIKRSKDHSQYKTNLKIIIDGEDKSGKGIRDSEKLLKEYLPDVTSSLIGSVILLGQGMPSRFSNNTPSGRKEVLEKLSKSDFMIEELKEKVSKRKTYLTEKQKELEIEDKNIDFQIDEAKKQVGYYTGLIHCMESDKNKFSELQNHKELLSTTKERLNSSEDSVNKLVSEKDQFEINCLQEREQVENSYRSELSNFENQIMPLSVQKHYIIMQIESLNRSILEAKNKPTSCPTCGRPFDGVEAIDTTIMESELQNLKFENEKVSKELSLLEANRDTCRKELSTKINALDESNAITRAQLIDDIKNTRKEVESHQNLIHELESMITRIELMQDAYEEKIAGYQNQISLNEEKIVDLTKNKMYNNTEKEKLTSRLAINSKMESSLKRDFRGILLRNVIDYISIQAKKYSQEVFETDKINFELDGNNINISYCGKQYENLSGGEKQKIDIIVQFSIRDMLCKFLNFSSNIIVLDEIFDNLDDIGTQRVLNLITKNLTDVNSIYIVTHHTDISIPFDRELVVIKNNDGISSIK